MHYFRFKRFCDIFFAFLGLSFFSPFFVVIIVLIKIDSKGPILFKQKRVGRNKKNFEILKFRTMKIDTPKDKPTHLLENPKKYITRIGSILRKTSLDELPQLINIIKGDMSFIGPRPALWNQNDLVEERDKYNVQILYPGLSGYAQVNGRDELSISEKAKLDGYYVQRISLFLDLKIFFRTIISIFKADGFVEGERKNINKISERDENIR